MISFCIFQPLEKRLKKLKEVIVVKNGDSSGSDSSPQGYDEEDSSRNSTDIDNQSLYVDAEEEEELWRQMAFAQESIKVSIFSE